MKLKMLNRLPYRKLNNYHLNFFERNTNFNDKKLEKHYYSELKSEKLRRKKTIYLRNFRKRSLKLKNSQINNF